MFGFSCPGQNANAGLADVQTWINSFSEVESALSYIIYVASTEFATLPTDDLANQPFRGTLSSYSFKRSILGGGVFGGVQTADGQLVISNDDAYYDFLPQQYAISGRQINIKLGRETDAYSDYFPLNNVTAADWAVDEANVTIDLRDSLYKLNVPIQANLYGGAGGSDGGADLAGKRKPLAYGEVLNIPPPLVVPSLLIYQVNDGSVDDIVSVYDRGVSLTKGSDYATYDLLAAATVSAGHFATCSDFGFFKLGSSPSGTITADVNGDNSGGGYVTTSANICRRIIGTKSSLSDPADIEESTFTAVNAAQYATIGYYIGENETPSISDVCTNIMTGVGGWFGFTRNGKVYVGIVSSPGDSTVDNFTREDVFGEARREQLPSEITPAVWRWRVAYQRVWQTQTDLAGSVSAARVAFVGNQFRLAESSNEDVKLDYPFAKDPEPIQSYFAEKADAEALADDLIELYGITRHVYRLSLPRRVLYLKLGDVVTVTYPRWDLSLGKNLVIFEMNETLSSDSEGVEVLLYG